MGRARQQKVSSIEVLNIVVIGGTRGIGLELCHHFARSGHNVSLCGKSTNAIDLADQLSELYQISAFGQTVDATDERSCSEFALNTGNYLGQIDVLFANAAVFGPVGVLEQIDVVRWTETIRQNTLAFVNPVRAFLPFLCESSSGRILTMSGGGLGGPQPIQNASAYFASKAAVVSLIEVLAEELMQRNITVNAIAPGFFPTDFMREALEVGPKVAGSNLHEDASRVTNDSTMETFRQLFTLVDFLISADASQVTGRTLSAKWDTPEKILRSVTSRNMFRLRRVDNDLIRDES